MPFRFICSRCGATLYEAEDILTHQTRRNRRKTANPPIQQFITQKIGLECPKCGNKLSTSPVKVEIFPIKKRQAHRNG